MNIVEEIAKAIGGLANDYCNPCTDEKIIKCKDCLERAQEVINKYEELKNVK